MLMGFGANKTQEILELKDGREVHRIIRKLAHMINVIEELFLRLAGTPAFKSEVETNRVLPGGI